MGGVEPENFFSVLKRGVVGTISPLERWPDAPLLAEFDFRYSTKDKSDTERAGDILKGMEGRRLTYRRIGGLAA
jgi:hypothetical protein